MLNKIPVFVTMLFLLLGSLFAMFIYTQMFIVVGQSSEGSLDKLSTELEVVYINSSVILNNFDSQAQIRVYNQTWVDQDGADDFIDFSSVGSIGVSQTWWAQNSTEGVWHFYANASDTHYVDGAIGTINQFIFNGTQTNTTFNGSIDSIRIYNLNLTAEDVLFLNSKGR